MFLLKNKFKFKYSSYKQLDKNAESCIKNQQDQDKCGEPQAQSIRPDQLAKPNQHPATIKNHLDESSKQ